MVAATQTILHSLLLKFLDEQYIESKMWYVQFLIPGGTSIRFDVFASEVGGWIAQCDRDPETSEELNDDQIITAVSENNGEEIGNEDSNGDDGEPPPRNLHTDPKSAFDIALQYIEQNSTSTSMGMLHPIF
ncbi:hypothetical protein QE152_g30156 [Popillia japonica]|uniref:Uncharacterized protein n=1 Tax=Popillia japonica TaxID=7064 RepID=A0AAW1JFF3_POPJA